MQKYLRDLDVKTEPRETEKRKKNMRTNHIMNRLEIEN